MQREHGKHAAKEKPQKPKKSRLSRQQKCLVAVAVILAVALAGVAAYKALFIRPDLNNKKPAQEGEEVQELDYGDGVRPRSDGERKSQDYYTVLILGRDTGGGGNTDTMLLASYDVTNQKATVMSIPRDTMVNIPYDIKRINAVYNYGGGGDKGSHGKPGAPCYDRGAGCFERIETSCRENMESMRRRRSRKNPRRAA